MLKLGIVSPAQGLSRKGFQNEEQHPYSATWGK
jgi:hypothetical protein